MTDKTLIYADPITVNCRKVLAGMAFLDAPFERVHVDYFKGEHKEPAYLAVNPNASVPTLAEGNFVLWESNAILQYVADKLGRNSAYPKDLQTRADINRWLLWESSSWFPNCYSFLVENCVKPLLGSTADPAVLEAQTLQFNKLAGFVADALVGARPGWLLSALAPHALEEAAGAHAQHVTGERYRPVLLVPTNPARWP